MAREAAKVFYSKTTFCFIGDHNWHPILSWLETIGANRGYLTRLEATIERPAHAWQERDGTRTELKHAFEELYPRSPHLYRLPESTAEGIVDNINPAIEAIFAVLSTREGGPKLTFTLLLDYGLLPGIQLGIDWQHPYNNYFSMDLPNLIEKLRVIYPTELGKGSCVEVLWKGEDLRTEFAKQRERIQERGWEILEAEVGEKCRPPIPHIELRPIPTMRFR